MRSLSNKGVVEQRHKDGRLEVRRPLDPELLALVEARSATGDFDLLFPPHVQRQAASRVGGEC